MKRRHLPRAIGAMLVAAIAACGNGTTPSAPGTATLQVRGTRGECHSFGGCAYVARLDGPGGSSEAEFQPALEGPDLALGAGLPSELLAGDYRITFELRLLSDVISNDGQPEFSTGATCQTAFAVEPGRTVINVLVTFGADTCSVVLAAERLE